MTACGAVSVPAAEMGSGPGAAFA